MPATPYSEVLRSFDFYGDTPVEILRVERPADQMAEEIFYLPAILLLGLVILFQRRRQTVPAFLRSRPMSRRILLPVDLSESDTARKALGEALPLLGQDGVLHVVSVLPDFGLPQVGGFFRKGFEKEALAAFGKALAEWVEDMVPEGGRSAPPCASRHDSTTRSCGPPRSSRSTSSLMASHRPAFQDYLLGPNAARVVRHARCSVYVVRD